MGYFTHFDRGISMNLKINVFQISPYYDFMNLTVQKQTNSDFLLHSGVLVNLSSEKRSTNNLFSDFSNSNKSLTKDTNKNLQEKLKKLKKSLQEKQQKYKYVIKYDKLLKNYYLEIIDSKTKKIVKTIPPEFLLKVERNLKKFLLLIEKLENLKVQKNSKEMNFENIEQNLNEIKKLIKDLDLDNEDIENLLSNYTEEYLA